MPGPGSGADQEGAKMPYDKTAATPNYKVGDEVWLRMPARRKGPLRKYVIAIKGTIPEPGQWHPRH